MRKIHTPLSNKKSPFLLLLLAVCFVTLVAPHASFAQEQPNPPVPAQTQASNTNIPPADTYECSKIDIVCGIANGFNWLLDEIVYFPLQWGGEAVGGAINVNAKLANAASLPFVATGWPIIRDISNIFFVFILLWIALSTIFDYQPFSAKTLLPRFIIAALLINFSLAIGTTVISIANNLGSSYLVSPETLRGITAIKTTAERIATQAQTPDKTDQPITDKTELETRLNAVRKKTVDVYWGSQNQNRTPISGAECDTAQQTGTLTNASLRNNTAFISAFIAQCTKFDSVLWKSDSFALLQTNGGKTRSLYAQALAKLVLYPATVFVLFAVAILLLIRYISLQFVLVLGPLAFLAMILPGTQKYWHDWWDKLIKWSVFLPAFSIMFYIATQTVIHLNTRGAADGDVGITDYLMTLFFIIGTLIVAQQLGIHGATTAMTIGKKWTNWAKGRGKEYGMRGIGAAAEVGLKGGADRIPFAGRFLGEAVIAGEKARKTQERRRIGDIKGLPPELQRERLRHLNASDTASALKGISEDDREKLYKQMPLEEQQILMNRLPRDSQNLLLGHINDPRQLAQLRGAQPGTPLYDTELAAAFNSVNKNKLPIDFVASMPQNLSQQLTAGNVAAIAESPEGVRAINTLMQSSLLAFNESVREYLKKTPGGQLISRERTVPRQQQGGAEKELKQILKGIQTLSEKSSAENEEKKP